MGAGRRGMLRRLRGVDDAGSTLVLVVGAMVVLSLVLLTALSYVVRSQKFARGDQDQQAAMSAAQSGVEEFLARLNNSSEYAKTADCTNKALKGPGVSWGASCGWGSATPPGWVPVVPGTTDTAAAHFHYTLDTSLRGSQGRITVISTGRVNGVYQTVQATVGEGGASDYVYYTDFESADPANAVSYPSGYSFSGTAAQQAAKKKACGLGANGYVDALHWWANAAGKSRNGQGCAEITFIGGDELAGKVFTNDTIYGTSLTIAGAVTSPSFLAQVTTANPTCTGLAVASNSDWQTKCLRSGSVANFNNIQPVYHAPDYLEDTADQFSGYPGCHYVGATRIIFSGTSMKVYNRSSTNGGAAPVAQAAAGQSAPSCGTGADINGQTVPVPDGLVIYVGDSSASAGACTTGEIDGTLPLANDATMATSVKECQKGNVYVEGQYDGQVTIATSQSIVVTGDLVRYSEDDLLGLVAQNSVEVFHPAKSDGTEISAASWPKRYNDPMTGAKNPASGIQIAAAIQTLQHSFFVQQYNVGAAKGRLFVVGSIAQRWRGAVGTNSGATGYLKNYTYNTRLTYTLPPYLPRWKDSQWSLLSIGEIPTPAAVKG